MSEAWEFSAVGGLVNPKGHEKCGPQDKDAKFLEPVHWGGCKGCYDAIKELYLERKQPEAKPVPKEQLRLF